ncbi:hypothetical protein GC170_15485 [bacterium]|nr:hypothetical protein [bacterium]
MTRNVKPEAGSTAERVRAGWAMLASQRPHAAWATWQAVLSQNPDDPAARAAMDTLAASPELPEVARKPLRFLPPASEPARQRWDTILRAQLSSTETPNSTDPATAALAFKALLESAPDDAEATWNLAVCQAWMGWNRSAVETLDRFVDIAHDKMPDRAADAWTLAELLRHGAGAEDLADSVKLSVTVPAGIIALDLSAKEIARAFGTLITYASKSADGSEPGSASGSTDFAADILDRPLGVADETLSAVTASVVSSDESARFSAPASPSAGLFFRELIDQWRFLEESHRPAKIDVTVLPIALLDAAVFRFRLPENLPESHKERLPLEGVAAYFESEWVEQPRYGLAGRTPLDASIDALPATKVRLEGIIHFLEQLAHRPGRQALYGNYDFDRLRYRLGLTSPPGKDDAKGEARHKALSLYDPNHVRRLKPEGLSPEDLAVAWETAFAVHDDDSALRLGAYIAETAPAALVGLSMADFVAPFLRRWLSEGPESDSGQKWLDFAMKTDAELHAGRDMHRLLEWKAELATRRGDAPAASLAWKAACEHPSAPPIFPYEAVIDMWEMPEGPEAALKFAADAISDSRNEYVKALLRKAMEMTD